VPHIPPELLESSIFLYGSQRDAESGANWGGSGVLVGFGAIKSRVHLYAATNTHVAEQCPVIRLIKHSKGSTEPYILVGTADDWWFHPDGDDLAIRSLGMWPDYAVSYVSHRLLIARDNVRPFMLGPGDDCLMIGRYINHDLQQFDRPTVRFGNIAMLPERIYQEERTFHQESFLVDMRSHSGFSGSPVFVYYEEPRNRWGGSDGPVSGAMGKTWLLGIDWGHLPIWTDIREGRQTVGRAAVSGGMAGVVPAWKLRELLDEKERKMERSKAEEELRDSPEGAAVLDANTTDEFDRFNELAKRLVAVPKRDMDQSRGNES